jgi:hypothetical protein
VSEFHSHGPLPLSRCPACDYRLDSATIFHGEDVLPEPRDFSVCLNCGQILVYRGDLTLRKATRAEISELMDDAEAWREIEKSQWFIAKRGKFA